MIEKIKAIINKLLGRELSVESIVAPFTKIQTQLEAHRQAQLDAAKRDHDRAAKIEARAQAEEAEAARAEAAAAKVANFFS